MGEPPPQPDFVLRGALIRGFVDWIVLLLVAAAFLLTILMASKIVEKMTPFGFVMGIAASCGLLAIFGRALWMARPRLQVHADHVVLDYRAQGEAGRCFAIGFEELASVGLIGVRVTFRIERGQVVEFPGNRLHVEDAFDILATHLEAGYPSCMILRRRTR